MTATREPIRPGGGANQEPAPMHDVQNGEIYRVTMACRAVSQNAINVKYIKLTLAPTAATTLQQFADALSNRMSTLYKNVINGNCTYTGLKMVRVNPEAGNPPFAISYEGAGAGITIGDALPPQVAGLIKLTTGAAGRSNRGRFYIPFPSEADSLAEGVPNTLYLTAVTPFVTEFTTSPALVTAGGTCAFDWGLMKAPWGALNWKAFEGGHLRTRFATQRRRSLINRGDGPFG